MKTKSWIIIILGGISITLGVYALIKSLNQETVEAFEKMNERLDEANKKSQEQLVSVPDTLNVIDPEGPGVSFNTKVNVLMSSTKEIEVFLETTKLKWVRFVPDRDYNKMRNSIYLDTLLFDGNELRPEGIEFKRKIERFRRNISNVFKDDFPEVVDKVNTKFSTENMVDREGNEIDWLVMNYKGKALIQSITKVSQMERDIELITNELHAGIARQQQE